MYKLVSDNTEYIVHTADEIRDLLFELTTDVEIAIDVHNWLQIATPGMAYTGRDFTVEVIK